MLVPVRLDSTGEVNRLFLQHFRNNAAILLKPGPLQEKTKTYLILALSDNETKSRKLSKSNH